MAEASWPSPGHNSRAVTDREYEEMVGSYATDGLVGSPDLVPLVYADATGMTIKVRADRRGLVRAHMWSSGPTEYTKAIGANASGSLRNDLVVLRLDRSTWNVTLEVRAGTPGAGVPNPVQDLGTSGVYELPVASVRVASGASSIGGTDVTPVGWYVGEQIIYCTSSTRPPAINGRRIIETNTGFQLVAVGTTWYRVPDERAGMGELGPYTLPPYSGVGSTPVTLFDQFVSCRPSHFHNIAARIRPQATAAYSHVTFGMEIDGATVANSGAVLMNGTSGVPNEFTFQTLGWRSGSAQSSFRLRCWISRYAGGTISGPDGGQLSIVDNGAGAGSGSV